MTTSPSPGSHEQHFETESPNNTAQNVSDSKLESGTNKKEDKTATSAAFVVQGFKLYAILLSVCFGAFVMSLDIFILATAIPSITSEFRDTSQLAWYPAAYSLTTCVLTPLAGRLAAAFPLRWVYITFCSIFLVGSIVCGWAQTSNAFIVGRAVAGIGASGLATGGMTIVLLIASPRTKPLFMGICSSCFALGVILGPILSGVFSEKATWRWCFWINLPSGAVTLATMFFFFRPPPESRNWSVGERIKSLDLTGGAIFIPGIFMILLALTWGGTQKAWNSPTIIGLFVGGGVMVVMFFIWEHHKGEEAMIPGMLLRRRSITFSVLFSFCHMGSVAVMGYYLPEWFQAVQGVNALESGTRTVTTAGTQIFGTLFAAVLALKIRFYNPWLFVGPILMSTAAALYSQFSTFNTPATHYIGYQVVEGLGVGMAQQMPNLIIQLVISDREELLPVVVALNLFSQYLGATLTQIIAGVVFHSVLDKELSNAGLDATQKVLLYTGGISKIRPIVHNLNILYPMCYFCHRILPRFWCRMEENPGNI
ncbi:hypothetical protein EsH8_V_001074 [Colletotrichum jinshuiense]